MDEHIKIGMDPASKNGDRSAYVIIATGENKEDAEKNADNWYQRRHPEVTKHKLPLLADLAYKIGAGVSYGFHPLTKKFRCRIILNGIAFHEAEAKSYEEAEAQARAWLENSSIKGEK